MDTEATTFFEDGKLNNYKPGNFRYELGFIYDSGKIPFLKVFLIICPILLAGCYVSKDPMRHEVKLLQKGTIKDDSSYVYSLPYEEGTGHRVGVADDLGELVGPPGVPDQPVHGGVEGSRGLPRRQPLG